MRIHCLCGAVVAMMVAAMVSMPTVHAEDRGFAKETFTYKSVGEVEIQADVYRFQDASSRPALVWIHGGALINGSRTSVPKQLLELAQTENYVLVSLDYRLAPEVQLPEIVADIKDAFRWLREHGRELGIDTERIVVSGGSAGGYLTMGTGIWVEPRPTALVAYWGYGDVDGEWYTQPSDHYRNAVALISEEEAFRGVRKRVLTGVTDPAEGRERSRYYLYLRQNGLWTKEVTGFDLSTEKQKLDPYCPVRNITAEYPPILMIHGTEDTDVPYELSADMAVELTKHKVNHLLITVPFAGHGLSGGDRLINATAHDAALSFIRAHLGDQ